MSNNSLYPLIWQVRRVFQLLRSTSEDLLDGSGVNPSQRAVLEFLVENPHCTVPRIAQSLSVSRQHIQVLVNELLALELLEVLPNPAHKRSPLVTTTAAGGRLFRDIQARELNLLESLEKHFARKELDCARQTLETLGELLKSKSAEDRQQ